LDSGLPDLGLLILGDKSYFSAKSLYLITPCFMRFVLNFSKRINNS